MARPEGRADRAGEPGGAGILPRRLAGSNLRSEPVIAPVAKC